MSYYDFPTMFEEIFQSLENPEMVGSILVGYVVAYIIATLYGLFVYILQSVGLYSVSKRRGIHHAWLSWIPFGNMWILGSIADQYKFVAKGKVTKNRRTLLGLQITYSLLMIANFAVLFAMIFSATESLLLDMEPGMEMMGFAIAILVIYFALLVIAIILTVFQYIALYGYFASCNPNNSVAFLVLGIFFSFLIPYFIFFSRKKDEGMPPRRVSATPVTWQPAPPPQPQQWQPAPPQQWQPAPPQQWQPAPPQQWQPPQPQQWQSAPPQQWQPPQPEPWQPPQPQQPQQPQQLQAPEAPAQEDPEA